MIGHRKGDNLMFKAIIIICIVFVFLLVAWVGRTLARRIGSDFMPEPPGCWICGATDGKHADYYSRPDGDV